MNFLDTLLWPFTQVVSWILRAFHAILTFVGMDPDSGWTWTFVQHIPGVAHSYGTDPRVREADQGAEGHAGPAARLEEVAG